MYGRDGAAIRPASGRFERAEHSGRRAVTAFRQPAPPQPSPFPELDALRRRFPAAFIESVERRAAALRVGADRVLVAQRAVTEEEYLLSYAVTTGISFEPLDRMPRAACPFDDDRMLDSVSAGILPFNIAGRLICVVAPRHAAARRMLQLVRANPGLQPRFRVTSAGRLEAYVLRHCSGALGARAAEALRTAAPDFSAAPGARSGAGRWLTILAALAAATFVAAPGEALAVTNIAVSLLFLAWMTIRLLGVFIAPPDAGHARRISDADLPVYTVIAALYREAKSVAGLVAALRKLDWPPEKLDIKLVVEPDDLETRAAIARLDLPPWFDIIVAPPVGPRTKPKALNAVLPFARGVFTVIYDAEDRPEPDQLRQALAAFLRHDRSLACVQAALTIDNTADGWLTRAFTAEYAAQFDVLLPSLARLRLPLPLGGSSNHFRTDSLRKIGGWDPYNVTEDADLGVRLARLGYRSTVIASTTYEEAPARWQPWLRQRTRWFKGWLQTWLVHSRAPVRLLRDLGVGGFVTFNLIVGGNVLAALIYPAFVALLFGRLIAGVPIYDESLGGLHMLALIGGLSAAAVAHLAGLARRRLLSNVWTIPLMPIHWLLLSVAAWRGLLQLLREPYRWEKTEHGLARSSRLTQRARPSLPREAAIDPTDTSANRPPPLRRSA
jgi:cellulose synthase/poly-beta-1,6-N-acetylglucosamine synthase-like glycosyltransferase